MKTRHFLQLLLLSATWGGSFVLLRIASPVLGPWGLAGMRCVLASFVLVFLMHVTKRQWPARATWPHLAFVSLLTVVGPFALFPLAALVLPAGYSAVLNTTAPLFGILAAAAMGDEKLTARRIFGCFVGFAGVALLVQLGPVEISASVVMAALACTLAAGTYGVGAILMKRATLSHDALPASAVVHVAAAAMLFIPAAISAPRIHFTWAAVICLLILGTVTSGFMYWVSLRLMREVPASAATSSAFMIPFFGVTWGHLFLGEPVTPGMLPGFVLVLSATLLVTGFNPFRAAPPEP